MGHIKMMGATQPFISGAISKTVNVPKEATRRRDHAGLHRVVEARGQGDLDLPRRQQAHAAAEHVAGGEGRDRDRAAGGGGGGCGAAEAGAPAAARRAPRDHAQVRHRRARGLRHRRPVRGRQPGEIFLVMAKEGSTISGFADAFAQAISYALQYGVPLQVLVDKFSHTRFEPSGMTQEPRGPLREVDRRLHLPLDGDEVPVGGGAVGRRREHRRPARARRCRRRRAGRRAGGARPSRRRPAATPARRSRARKTRRRARRAARS